VPASGAGKRVVYSINKQRVWLVDARGFVVRTYLVSGRLTQPRPGSYRVFSKSRHTSSSVSNERMQYMVRFTYGTRTGTPLGFHDIPQSPNGTYAQTLAQLGKPLSHGCVRQSRPDAARLWAFAPVGTRVVVVR
jgi:lipoprotein-anchoring transpeptidase ErfK/SrfK